MIPLFKVFIAPTVLKEIEKILYSGYIGEGDKVKEFECALSRHVGNNAVATNNGTSAIQLALRLAGVGNGDEVISTPMTCSATNMPILAAGAKIVWADINPWTGNIDPKDVKRKVTPKTKAIMCVDWGGYPCDFDELNIIAKEHGIKLIEDACHAFGSSYKGKPVGSHCDYSCFSFQAIKHLTTVDGGLITCNGDYERAKLLRWYGIDRDAKREDLRCEADITEYGYKFHMNDVTAAIGLEQLAYIDINLNTCLGNAKKYDDAGLSLMYRKDRQSCYWLYTTRVKNRDNYIKRMRDVGIVTSKVHVRNDKYTVFKDSRTFLPGVDEFYSEQVSIPVGWWVGSDGVDKIIEETRKWQG